MLDLEEFEVITAHDGQDALEAVRTRPPDVVVCDVSMPGVDGLEVCRQLKADQGTCAIPVILLTAHGGPKARAAGESAGCDAYLTKPFSPLQLIDLIRELGAATSASEV